MIVFVAKIHHFAKKRKVPRGIVKGSFGNFPKRLTHFEEESYEIVKIFGRFGLISSSLL
jgi:hypothetical protein